MKRELFGIKLAILTYFILMILLVFLNFNPPTDGSAEETGVLAELTSYAVYEYEEPSVDLISNGSQNLFEDDYNFQIHVMFGTREPYVIELDQEPTLIKQLEIQQNLGAVSINSQVKSAVDSYTDEVDALHNMFKINASSIIHMGDDVQTIQETGGDTPYIISEYTKIFNGFLINATYDEIVQIAELPYVRKIEKEKTYTINVMESVPLINADDVWNLSDGSGNNLTGKGITIAIIDTGIDYNHVDLGGCMGANCKVIDGYDFVNNDADPMDDHGHGTHVAATAAGNGTLKGVAPSARLIAYKVCNSGGGCGWTQIINAINHSVDPNQDGDPSDHYDILSMSLGGSGSPDDTLSRVVDSAVSLGIVATISAGNSGPSESSIGSPGTARKAITVGASSKNDIIAYFSSRGPTKIGTLKPDITAPGVAICAAQWDSAWDTSKCYDDEHVAISGTSMAAPHAAGVAALIIQAHPDWTPNEVKYAMRNTAVDIDYGLTTQGHGRVDALKAVMLNKTPCMAEFYTYGFESVVGGNLTINGTANCTAESQFSNYTVYYGIGQSVDDDNITSFSPTGDPEKKDTVNYSFSGTEDWYITLKLPKLADVKKAELKVYGSNHTNGLPYLPKVDFGNNGEYEWEGFHNAIAQTRYGSGGFLLREGGTYLGLAQSFNWTGGELKKINLFLWKYGTSGQGVRLEIRNNSASNPSSGVIVNLTRLPSELNTGPEWVEFDIPDTTLEENTTYWLIVTMENLSSTTEQYRWYYDVDNPYPGGVMKYNYSGEWHGYTIGDFAFKLIDGNYFEGSETVSNFESEINTFLTRCNSDLNNTCDFPIKISSTNGTFGLSELFISYEGKSTSDPVSWIHVCNGTSSKKEEKLCSLDTTTLSDQKYAFRLDVKGNETESRDYLFFEVNNYDIIYPENGYITNYGVEVRGKSKSGDLEFENYTLDYKENKDSGWTLINFSENTVNDGVLGYFNSTLLPAGNYTIILKVYLQGNPIPILNNVTVTVDKMLQEGWPQETDFVIYTSPKVIDVDNDGDLEIVVASSRNYNIFASGGDYTQYNRSLYIFHHNGSIMNGWPKPIPYNSQGRTFLVEDLDKDGDREIIYLNPQGTSLVAWHHNGSVMNGWPISIGGTLYSHPVLADLDNDTYLDVIFLSGGYWDMKLRVYNHTGTKKWESAPGAYRGYGPLAVADVNKDGKQEILVNGQYSGGLFLLNSTGSVMPGWPFNYTIYVDDIFSTTIGDIDGDMDMEIIFFHRGTGIEAKHHDGTNVDGWPQGSGGRWLIEIITSDVDNDRALEVIEIPFIYGGWSSAVMVVYNGNGSILPGYPYAYPGSTLHFRPVVADINNDGKYEVVVGTSGNLPIGTVWKSFGWLTSFNTDPPAITGGFPLYPVTIPTYSRSQESSPLVVDLDGDGDLELGIGVGYYTDRYPLGVFNGGRYVIWDLDVPYNESMVEWNQYLNNPRNTNAYIDVDFDNIGFNDTCPYDFENDADSDGICGDVDICPLDPDNDADSDGICGDVDICPLDPDNDADSDGLCSNEDNCPAFSNPLQEDGDSDGIGNLCDNCINVSNPDQSDQDNDGMGDLCDRVSGNSSTINTTMTVNITIGNSTNLSQEFNGTFEVKLFENSILLFDFVHNFSQQTLDLVFSIDKNITLNRSYMIITGLKITGKKRIYITPANTTSNAVCILDKENVTIAELLSSCIEIKCPGSTSGYNCTVSSGTFIVSGLNNSGLIEKYIASPPAPPPPDGGSTGGSSGSSSGGGGTAPAFVGTLPEDEVYVPMTSPPEEPAPSTPEEISSELPSEEPAQVPQEEPSIAPILEQPRPALQSWIYIIFAAALVLIIVSVIVSAFFRKNSEASRFSYEFKAPPRQIISSEKRDELREVKENLKEVRKDVVDVFKEKEKTPEVIELEREIEELNREIEQLQKN